MKDTLDIRKHSVFSSSAESLTSFEESFSITTQEQLYENIRLHKEIITQVKTQPWSLSKKYKIVQRAKQYVSHHEGTLQERFALSGNTKDLYARFKIRLADRFKHMKRELYNFLALLIPWEIRIKEIESRFGSVVASYFIFLRWLFWVNLVIASVFALFVIVPEVIATDANTKDDRKILLPEEKKTASNFITIWDFEGSLKYSPMFYGYYSNQSGAIEWGYKLPIAYFLAGLFVYVYSFAATLRKMAENSRMAKLGSKEDECVFSWKLFTGWDFMIGHSETAANRVASVVLGFKEALLEEAEKQKDKQNWKTTLLRIFANMNVLLLLYISAYAVVYVVDRSDRSDGTVTSWWRKNEITVVMSLISFIFPMLFELLGLMEYYHPRMQLRLQLARIMILNLLNLYSLIWALFGKIDGMTTDLAMLKNASPVEPATTTANFIPGFTDIFTSTEPSLTTMIENLSSITMDAVTTTVSDIFNQTEFPFSNFTGFQNTSEDPTEDTTETYDYNNYDYFEKNEILFNLSSESTNYDDDLVANFTLPNNSTSNSTFTNDNNVINSTADFSDRVSSSLLKKTLPTLLESGPTIVKSNLTVSHQVRSKLRKLCWETMFGQELVKLTVMDLLLTVLQILILEFFRALFVRYMNSCWCWDLEKRFPKYPDFKIAENILHLVNNQGMVWMGMFFSPGLAILNLIKLVVILYLRSWAVLTCNVPHEVVFRASRSNNFYLTLLLTMLFLCVLPVSYAIVWLEPSWHCGPFSGKERIYYLFTETLMNILPTRAKRFMDYIASPAAIIPLLLLLVLFIYYLISLTGALREANQDLKTQLHKERTEERKKMMRLMENKIMDSVNANSKLTNRWKKVLEVNKPNQIMFQTNLGTLSAEETADRKKLLLTKAMKNILRKKYSTDEDRNPKIMTSSSNEP
ncbi:unnamed protein product [Diamesa serratosioi]